MASFTISYTASSVRITVSGIASGDEVRYYVRKDPDPGYAVVDEKYVETSVSAVRVFGGLSGGTAYAANVRVNGTWVGAQTFTTPKARPDNWAWTSAVSKGSRIRLSAAEWNSFCARINEFRIYAGLSGYSFSTVQAGTLISAGLVNQARNAIGAVNGHGVLPSAAVKGGAVTAAFFNGLKDALNAIP